MVKFFRSMHVTFLLIVVVLIIVTGCSPSPTKVTQAPSNIKKMPDQITKVKAAILTSNVDVLPWYIADKKGLFKKYNLDVELTMIDTGPNALRALQSGDIQFVLSLPEPFIVGAAEGAAVKVVGAMMTQSLYSIFVSPDIQKIEDLKGKIAAGLAPGNGTDLLIEWLLRKHGLEPNKDVRIIAAGGNSSRMEAIKTGQAQLTLLSTPSDQVAEVQGLKRLGLVRDEIKNYNHEVIATNAKILNEKPEVARAFIAATSEAIDFVKNGSNRKEVMGIGAPMLKVSEESLSKSLDFVTPSYADKCKLSLDGLNLAIDILKSSGNLKKDISVSDFTDERYYVE